MSASSADAPAKSIAPKSNRKRASRIDRAALEPHVGDCLHAGRSFMQADLFEIEWEGRACVLKDFGRRQAIVRHPWGRFIIAWEGRALERLAGVEGVPELLGRAGPFALLIERLDADRIPRNRDSNKPGPEFFDRANDLIGRMHARGIAHGDLRRMNILIDGEGRPYLIDFATAVTAKPGVLGFVSRRLFAIWVKVDLATMARIKSEFHPDCLTKEEAVMLAERPWYLRCGRWLKRNVYRLRKPHHRRELRHRVRRRVRGRFKRD